MYKNDLYHFFCLPRAINNKLMAKLKSDHQSLQYVLTQARASSLYPPVLICSML